MHSPHEDAAAREPSPQLDQVVAALGALRTAAGDPSFGDIALGVARARRARGIEPVQSRVGRTTVYDAFRTGRRRLDADLVGDIARALGGDESTAEELMDRCRAAQSGAPVAIPDPSLAPEPVQPVQQVTMAEETTTSLVPRVVAVIVAVSLVVNLAGRGLVDLLGLPVYLDMIGTAFTAIALGPWWGVLVGVSTNGAGAAISGVDSWWFAPVNAVGALVWGYGVRRFAMGRSIPRFFVLNVLASLGCTSVAAVIIVGVLGGATGHGADQVTSSVLELSRSLWVAVGVSNTLSSLSDKLLSGFVALAVVEALPRVWSPARPTSWLR